MYSYIEIMYRYYLLVREVYETTGKAVTSLTYETVCVSTLMLYTYAKCHDILFAHFNFRNVKHETIQFN